MGDPFNAVSSQPSFSSIKQPMKAYTRAFKASAGLRRTSEPGEISLRFFETYSDLFSNSALFWTGGRMFVQAIPFNLPFVCQLAASFSEMSSCMPTMFVGLWPHFFSSPSQPLHLILQRKFHCPPTSRAVHNLCLFSPLSTLFTTGTILPSWMTSWWIWRPLPAAILNAWTPSD